MLYGLYIEGLVYKTSDQAAKGASDHWHSIYDGTQRTSKEELSTLGWLSGLGSQAPLHCLPLILFLLPKTYIRVCTQTHTHTQTPEEEE